MPKIFENEIVFEYVSHSLPGPGPVKSVSHQPLRLVEGRDDGGHRDHMTSRTDKNSHSPIHTILHLHKKYPNPHATHVVSVDAVERSVDPQTGVLRSERIIGVQQGAPKWITKVCCCWLTCTGRDVNAEGGGRKEISLVRGDPSKDAD